MNQLILGDNLEIMRKMEPETIDLIYLDPPFFSNRNYEVIWGDKGEVRSFEDRWAGGIEHYIEWLYERVAEMHRLLKPTGSIYLHCDWHANTYIRVYILDKLFGDNNFINEITWIRSNPKSLGNKRFPNCKDTIYSYSKSNKYNFNKVFGEHNPEYIEKAYKYIDDRGRKYRLLPLLNPNDDRPNLTYEFLGVKRVWRWTKDRMQKAYEDGLVVQLKPNAVPQYIKYLENSDGRTITDNWPDIENISRKEEIGYPTQKPEKLLERIIKASSNEGDLVLDPFAGGGTTLVVADKLNRRWIGIDQSVQAIKVSEMRLEKQQNLFSLPFSVQLHKYDYDTLRYKDAFEFESWIITQFGDRYGFGAIPQNKKGGDRGFDGKTRTGTPIQVKRSDNISVNVVKNFYSSCVINDKQGTEKRKKAKEPIGYIIAFSFGTGAVQEAAKLKLQEDVIIKLVRVDEIVEVAKKPRLSVKVEDKGKDAKGLRELEFVAYAESDSGIEFYSFDFEYKEEDRKFNASVMIDKDGRHTHKFKAGAHSIGVKAVDNEGLEAVEVVKIKVNGEVEVNS